MITATGFSCEEKGGDMEEAPRNEAFRFSCRVNLNPVSWSLGLASRKVQHLTVTHRNASHSTFSDSNNMHAYPSVALPTLRSALAPKQAPHPLSHWTRHPPISQRRAFHFSSWRRSEQTQSKDAKDLNQQALDKEESDIEHSIAQEKDKQQKTPWHREGSNVPPVARPRSAGAMTKGNR